MKQNKTKVFSSAIVCMLFLFIFGNCASSKSNFDKEYAETWKKVLQTQAWKDALSSKETASSDDAVLENNDTIVKPTAVFTKKYNSLVSRAYFKIISSAEKASKNIKAEYNRLDSEKSIEKNRKNKEFKNSLELAGKRYKAHNNMLEGLKSWKIFTDDITGDLKYFKAENENQIHNMYLNGDTDDSMINILVYKLADLYHFEE